MLAAKPTLREVRFPKSFLLVKQTFHGVLYENTKLAFKAIHYLPQKKISEELSPEDHRFLRS